GLELGVVRLERLGPPDRQLSVYQLDVGRGVRKWIGCTAAGRGRQAGSGRRVSGTPSAGLLCAFAVARHEESARFAVVGVAPAPAAVLAQLDALGVIALALVGLVIPALTLLASEGDGDPDVSAGHLRAPVRA